MTHDITLSDAATKTANFQQAYPNALKGGSIPFTEIRAIGNQAYCVNLRYYFALDDPAEPNNIHIVLVGVDSNGNDINRNRCQDQRPGMALSPNVRGREFIKS